MSLKSIPTNARASAFHVLSSFLAIACCSTALLAQSTSTPGSAQLADTYLTATDSGALAPAQFTIEARIRPDATGFGSDGNFGYCIVAKPRQNSLGSHLESWGLYWSAATRKIAFDLTHVFATTGETLVSNASIAPGQTAQIAATFDGVTLKLYIDGVLDGSLAASSAVVYNSTTEPVLIGAANFDFSTFRRRFSGLIDDVRIWGRARTAAEIAANASCPLTSSSADLLANWVFDNNSAVDVSGNGHPGVWTGAAAYGPSLNPDAAITLQPAPASACLGRAAVFNVQASASGGGAPLTYTWRRAGTPIVDDARHQILSTTSGSSLVLTSVAPGDLGSYDVVVQTACAARTSNAAALTLRTTGCPSTCVADVDDGTGTGSPDGGVTIDDLLYFLQRFTDGC